MTLETEQLLCTYLVQSMNATAQKVRCSMSRVIDDHTFFPGVLSAGGDPNPVITN